LSRNDKEKAKEIFSTMQSKLPEWRFSKEQNRFVLEFKKDLK